MKIRQAQKDALGQPANCEEAPPSSQNPWDEGRHPSRYKRYKKNLERRNKRKGKPGLKPLNEKDWWNQHGSKPPHNINGGEGKKDHSSKVKELKRLARSEYPGYRIISNRMLPGLARKPDVAVIDQRTGKVVKVYEAARFNTKGKFKGNYEKPKIKDYEKKRIPYEFHPVGENKPPGGVLRGPPNKPKAPN